MKILVTGGTGFSGKALVKRLLDLGQDVVALDYKEGIKTDELRKAGAEVVIGSVADKDVVTRSTQGVDKVFHLAAAFRELNVEDSYYDEINVQGSRNVLEAAYKQKVKKFIYVSTCGVHGNVEKIPAPETAAIKPADYYQRTKYEAEPLVAEYHAKGMNTVILRPAAIYGPGDPERFGMIFRRVAKGKFPMFGSGKTLYHPLYVDNFVDVMVACMDEQAGNGEAYLIADEEYLAIEDLVTKVGEAMDVQVKIPHFPVTPLVVAGHVCEKLCKPFHITPPIFPRRVDWYRQNRAFDISKAKRELGYAPKVGIDEGLRRTAQWYKQEGYL